MIFFISYDYKAFPINLDFLNIVKVCPQTLYFDLEEAFFTKKRFKRSNRQSAQKVHKKGHKKLYHFTDSNVYKNLIFVVSFLC